MKVTLKQISDDTGFSISTISRVLNGNDKISSKTYRKVLNSAEKLGYDFPLTLSDKKKETLNFILIASGFHEGEFYPTYFHGLNRASEKNGVKLFLHAIISKNDSLIKKIEKLASEFYDGIILFIPELTQIEYQKIYDCLPHHFPIISNSLIENPVFQTVTFDSYSGGYLAAQHFENRGYRNLGIIMGPHERSESRFRKNGFLDYVSQTDNLSCIWISNGNFTYNSGISAFKQFHHCSTKPEAIFACNDTMATAFLETAKLHGYAVPKDIAILGYDDLPNNKYTNPPLSSIHTNYEKLGDATIKALIEKVTTSETNSSQLSFVSVDVAFRETS